VKRSLRASKRSSAPSSKGSCLGDTDPGATGFGADRYILGQLTGDAAKLRAPILPVARGVAMIESERCTPSTSWSIASTRSWSTSEAIAIATDGVSAPSSMKSFSLAGQARGKRLRCIGLPGVAASRTRTAICDGLARFPAPARWRRCRRSWGATTTDGYVDPNKLEGFLADVDGLAVMEGMRREIDHVDPAIRRRRKFAA
jgi:hypothetical protein